MTSFGFPREHWQVVWQTWRWVGWTVGLTGLATVGLISLAVFGRFPLLPGAIAAAIFLLACLSSFFALYDTYRHAQVIPYFEKTVGGIDTFLAGQALLRHLQPLDELATELGVAPLSSVGFQDDLCGEEVTWRSAEEGLDTTRALLAAIRHRPSWLQDTKGVVDDLEKLIEALEKARRRKIRFSLLLRHCHATSGLEWERRQGTAC